MYDLLEAGQQHLPQRDAADGTTSREVIAADTGSNRSKELQHIHPLGDETNALRGFAAGACEAPNNPGGRSCSAGLPTELM